MNIPPAPGYGVYISKLIDHPRAYSLYSDFLQRHRLPSYKLLLKEFFLENRLILCFKTFIGRNQHLVEKYSVTCVQRMKSGNDN